MAKLEEGKVYLTRRGALTGPLVEDGFEMKDPKTGFLYEAMGDFPFYVFSRDIIIDNPCDIIAGPVYLHLEDAITFFKTKMCKT